MAHAVAVRKANEVIAEGLSEAAEQYRRGSKAATTMKAYGSDLRDFHITPQTGKKLERCKTIRRIWREAAGKHFSLSNHVKHVRVYIPIQTAFAAWAKPM